MTPLVNGVVRSDTKSSRIIPSVPGDGLPRLSVCTAVAPPLTKICME